MAATIFSSPTAVGAKIITISITVTNTSGAYSATINDMRLTSAMKAIKLELSNPEIFGDKISVNCSNAMLTISCNEVSGTSTVDISVIKVCDDPTAVTSTEFDILDNTIGDIDDLETSSKSNLVSAVNENTNDIFDLQEGLAIIANGNTHASISSGQFVYVRNHATLPDGLYKATSTISTNAALTTSNLTDASGALNNVQEQITTINNNVGTVPNGQTVEGQITELNSKFTWQYLGEFTGTNPCSITTVFNEIMVVATWGINSLVSVSCVYSYASLDSVRRFIGGTYSASNDYHGVQINLSRGSVSLQQWISNSGDQTSTSKIRVYIR